MRNLCEPKIACWRNAEVDRAYGTLDDDRAFGGAFEIPFRGQSTLRSVWLRVLASRDDGEGSGMGWDHVSVSLPTRCPTWEEMEFVKRLFFKPDETAMQLHVPARDHINNHSFCLHLWRPVDGEIPRPPAILVGLPGVEAA